MDLTAELQRELQRAQDNDLLQLLSDAADTSGLPLEYVLAVASRESDISNVLGDNGFAVGVMQIDIRFHAIAKEAKATGSWREDPTPLINYGVNLLAENRDWAEQTFPDFGWDDGDGWLKIAASAYNAGQGGAKKGVNVGDSDRFTTGHNYGADVLARMATFAALLNPMQDGE